MNTFVENLFKTLNENQGVLAATAFGITFIGGILAWFFKKNKLSPAHNKSSYIIAGHGITAGGDIIVGGSKISQQTQGNSPIPEINLHLYGAGSKRTIEGHIEKKSGQTLVLESIQINGKITDFEQQFIKLIPIKNLNCDDDLFTTKIPKIEVKVLYKTLTGEKYILTQELTQTDRADGLYNVSLVASPIINKL
jgi:hypothetical protein